MATYVKEPHAAVMALLAIMLSQIGFVYALFSVPIIVLSRDIFRYVYGRLNDPPRPAGLLPDDPRPIAPPGAAGAGHNPQAAGLSARGAPPARPTGCVAAAHPIGCELADQLQAESKSHSNFPRGM